MALRILLIDDNPDDRALAVRELRRAFPGVEVTEVGRPEDFARAMAGFAFDVVVTDYQLKWNDGISVLRAVKSQHPDVPVIMFTASGSEVVAVEGMKAGLDDYVIKSPKHLVRLGLAVQGAVQRSQASRRATLLEVRQQQLLNRLAVGVCRLSLDGALIECNPAFLRLCGVASLEAAKALDLTPLLPGAEDRARLLAHPRDNGHHADFEATLTRGDGGAVWVSVNATLSTAAASAAADAADGGPPVDVVDCVVEDVTTRKRLTDELRAASAAKDQFLAVLSHELRTPLTPVLATVTAMEEDEARVPAELRPAIEMIRRNVELEARLIDDLLDLTKIARGKMQLQRGVVDVHAAVQAALEICRSDVYAKRLAVSLELGAAGHHVEGDAARVQQILWNLIKNAVKFTPAGGRLTVRSANVRGGGDGGGGGGRERLRVEVTDTGVGIEPSALERIFNAFEQSDETVARRFGGLGLGLAISRALAEAQGGTLTAASAGLERGATFALEMPAVPAGREDAADGGGGEPQRAARGPLRILLVEDHADTLRVLSRLLRRLGHDVRTASTVEAARRAAAGATFDLVVSDLGLPDGSGLDLMAELHARYGLRGVAVSGYGMEDDVRKSLESGFAAHVTKPVNFQRLQAVIGQVAAGARSGRPRG